MSYAKKTTLNYALNYTLVAPENFSTEHKRQIENIKKAIGILSSQTCLILGAKDIHSRHLIATDSYAHLVGLQNGTEITGLLDRDIPCQGTAKFADCFVEEDQRILNSRDINKTTSFIKIHEFTTGTHAFITEKNILKHHESESILGTVYHANEIAIDKFFGLFPNYFTDFGIGCSREKVDGIFKIEGAEHEVAFLLALNWDLKLIAFFMNKYRPCSTIKMADTIYECRNTIAKKLNNPHCSTPQFRDMLVNMGVHRRMPASFFDCMVGTNQTD